MSLTMNLPAELRSYSHELGPALATPILAAWNPDDSYHEAKQCEAIGRVLIDRLAAHRDLTNASITYIFREKMKTRDRVVLGKMSKADGKLSFFNGFDFVMEINWQEWKRLSHHQRLALIDHELSHAGREEDAKGEKKYVLQSHDVEEFGGIVKRWGLWKSDLVVFAGAVVPAHQLGMFEGAHD